MAQKIPHWLLQQRQAMSLSDKIKLTRAKIQEWHEHYNGKVYASVSGGLDSTVMWHIVHSMYPDVPAVFAKALPYPEILKHVKTIENLVVLKPKKTFVQITQEYGWPVVSKRISMGVDRYRVGDDYQKQLRLWGGVALTGKKQAPTISQKWHFLVDAPFKISERCCYYLKESLLRKARKQYGNAMIGIRVTESAIRAKRYYKRGCNAFSDKAPTSWPLAFWSNNDVWNYIRSFDVPYSHIYNMGYKSTGCFACAYGADQEKEPNRFQMMAQTHPRLYDWCGSIGLWEVLDFIGVNYK